MSSENKHDVNNEQAKELHAGFNNPDPKVQEQWAKIPRKGDIPTPDEWMAQAAKPELRTP